MNASATVGATAQNLREGGGAIRERVRQDRRLAWAAGLAGLAFAIVLPYFFQPASAFVDHCVTALAYVVMALGLNIVVGLAGLLDLGYVAFFATGASSAGWFASTFFAAINKGTGLHILAGSAASHQPGIHVNFLLVLVIAACIAAFAGVLIGLPTLRLRGDYIAIVTLAFGEIVRVVAINGQSIHFGHDATLTAGRQGITPIDSPQLPGITEFNPLDLRPWYWFALALVLIVLFVNRRLRDSRP